MRNADIVVRVDTGDVVHSIGRRFDGQMVDADVAKKTLLGLVDQIIDSMNSEKAKSEGG